MIIVVVVVVIIIIIIYFLILTFICKLYAYTRRRAYGYCLGVEMFYYLIYFYISPRVKKRPIFQHALNKFNCAVNSEYLFSSNVRMIPSL
jgi:hypothetical protein